MDSGKPDNSGKASGDKVEPSGGSGLDESGGTSLTDQKSTLIDASMVGQVLDGRYRLQGLLGEGAAGVVFRALDMESDKTVAVKVLNEELRTGSRTKSRFNREGKALAKLSHPHIVDIVGYGIAGEIPYIAMEFLEGQTLEEMLDEAEPLDFELAVTIARQMLSALAFAHQSQVVHRDLKPGNVFLQRRDNGDCHVKLLDFGLAKFLAPDDPGMAQTLTRTGMVMGTPLYMSPEQAVGGTVDVRVDVYAAGSVIFEMFTGRPPFLTDTHHELVRAHLIAPVPRLTELITGPAANPALETFINRAMAKEPANRFDDAAAMLEAFEQALATPIDKSAAADRSIKRGKGKAPFFGRQRVSLALVALLGIGLMAVFAGLALLGDGEESSESSAEKTVSPQVRRLAGRDLLRELGIPEDLAGIHDKIEQGRLITREDLKKVQNYAHKNSSDARPFLLLARGFAQQHWRKDAIARYLRAFRIDPGSRGDPRMLKDLLDFTASDQHGNAACDAIAEIYGREALAAVKRLAGTVAADSSQASRLNALITKISK